MNLEDRKNQIRQLNAQIGVKKAEIKLLEYKIESAQSLINSLLWVKMEWDDLEKELIERKHFGFQRAIYVIDRLYHQKWYAYIKEEDDNRYLQIGPYYHTAGFNRGEPVLVHYNFNLYKDSEWEF